MGIVSKMSSRRLNPTSRGADITKLTPMERMFIEELLADEQFNLTAAARKAGYKQPSTMANRLISRPAIRKILGKALQERITRCRLTADEVLEHLRNALFLDPLDLFERTEEGGYVVRSLEDVPLKVRRCITKLKQRTRYVGESVETYLEVELMSKDAALVNAMKHLMLVNPDPAAMNVNVGVDLRGLLEQVEQDRKNVIDGNVIKRMAEGE